MLRVVLAGLLCAGLACALQTAPGDEPVPEDLRRALSLHEAGDYNGAISAYQDFLKAHPEDATIRSNLGAALAHEGRFADAIREYRLALDADPKNSRVRLNLALADYKIGHIAEAAKELVDVHAAEPEDRQGTLLLADCYLRQGDYRKIIDLLEPAAGQNGGDLASKYLLGIAYIRDNQVPRGQPLIDEILRNGDSAEARLLMGTAKMMVKDLPGARVDLARAVELNPKLPEAQAYLGLALLRGGDIAGGEKAFRGELQLDPNNFDANLQLGGILRQQQNYTEARMLLERALRIRPGDFGVRYQLATVKLADGDAPGAQKDLESLVRDAPDFVQAHVTLATIYYREKRRQDGDREREIVRKLNAELQAKQPGVTPAGQDTKQP